jgi:uncharacterized membrane protein
VEVEIMQSRSLNVPRSGRRLGQVKLFDADSFGSWSEQFARYMGTSKFIVQMSVFIAAWLIWNTVAPADLRWDPYTFTFLTLLLSLQASYAAPLILLAQNRQDDRDRAEARTDRQRAAVGLEANAFITRELADLRGKLNELSVDVNVRQGQRTEKAAADLGARLATIEKSLEKLTEQLGASQ